MPARYDPDILQHYADQLYRDAKWIIFTTALRYSIITFVIAMLILMALDARARFDPFGSPNVVPVWAVTIAGLLIGLEAGRRKGFRLKLEAQKVLCDRQIELNTRTQNISASVANG
ncbi:MAG TPA: hypothetical protein VJ848_11020 [Candidatus Angelobacter sp.]|nr:hypothetical protein [Candidatus Angelobacter sp.]